MSSFRASSKSWHTLLNSLVVEVSLEEASCAERSEIVRIFNGAGGRRASQINENNVSF